MSVVPIRRATARRALGSSTRGGRPWARRDSATALRAASRRSVGGLVETMTPMVHGAGETFRQTLSANSGRPYRLIRASAASNRMCGRNGLRTRFRSGSAPMMKLMPSETVD